MKKISTSSMTARATIGALFFVTGIFLAVFGLFTARLHSAQPSSGTLNSGGPAVNWVGTAVGGGSLPEREWDHANGHKQKQVKGASKKMRFDVLFNLFFHFYGPRDF